MEVKAVPVSDSGSQVFTFGSEATKMSKHQPLDITPGFSNKWLTNGKDNGIFKRYKDAYDDSPTNSSIIDGFANYIFGDGLINLCDSHTTKKELKANKKKLAKYISQEDVQLICHDYKRFGGYSVQIIYNFNETPLRIEYIPIYKLGISFADNTVVVDGYWFSWDWKNTFKYRPMLYPRFTGEYKGNDLEILVVRRPTAEPFFPVPDYFSAIPWAEVEGQLANSGNNHFVNVLEELTVINYNNGKMPSTTLAKKEADDVREKYAGTNNNAKVIVSFNEDATSAVTVDRVGPPELNQQNVFFSEEAERKIRVGHSAPAIIFAGSSEGNGFSSNADELAIQTKSLYRRHINPSREKILQGLQSIFDLIPNYDCELDLIDFVEETNLDNNTAE